MFGLVSEFKSSLIFWALPLLPSVIASYTGLALVCASTAIYAVYHQTPSEKLRRLLDGITTTWEILNSTKTDSGSYAVRVRGIPSLLELEDRLLQAQLSASLIRVRLLELREKPWAGYLRSLPRVITDMDQCARDVKKIHVETLLVAEEERQQNIRSRIRETRAVLAAIRHPSVIQAIGFVLPTLLFRLVAI